MKKSFAVMLVAALVAAAFVVPAEAGKRRKKKKKKPPVCQPYAPGEMGAEAETLVVKDEHTEEAPLLVPVSLDMSAADADLIGTGALTPGRTTVNLQVDSKAPISGLNVLFEFPEYRDYDLRLYYPTGEEAAASHAFQPMIMTEGTPADISNQGGNASESSEASEKIVGLATNDCGGWTLQAENWFGEGGDFELKVWLGAAENEPLAPGEAEG